MDGLYSVESILAARRYLRQTQKRKEMKALVYITIVGTLLGALVAAL